MYICDNKKYDSKYIFAFYLLWTSFISPVRVHLSDTYARPRKFEKQFYVSGYFSFVTYT